MEAGRILSAVKQWRAGLEASRLEREAGRGRRGLGEHPGGDAPKPSLPTQFPTSLHLHSLSSRGLAFLRVASQVE